MKRLCIIAAHTDLKTDPRVYKQVVTATKSGWVVDACFYNTTIHTKTIQEEEGCTVTRIPFSTIVRYITLPPMLTCTLIEKYLESKLKNTNRVTEILRLYTWSLMMYFIVQLHFFKEISEKKADVYHATDLLTLLTGVLLKRKNGGKLVYDSHEMWIESIENITPFLKKILYIYEGFLIKQADVVTTVNQPIANELSRKYKIKTPTVVMNTPFLQVQPNHEPHDAIRVIYQGRYTRNRGIESAIRAISELPGVQLYMRGIDAYMIGDYEPYVEELKKIAPNVIFLPPVDMKDLVTSLGDFDIGIVPYIGNNFNNLNASPNKIFEYMMAGLAVVASDIPVLTSILTTCECGCTYEQYSPESLRKSIIVAVSDLNKFKQNARRCAESNYNWDVQGKKFIDIYNELIK